MGNCERNVNYQEREKDDLNIQEDRLVVGENIEEIGIE